MSNAHSLDRAADPRQLCFRRDRSFPAYLDALLSLWHAPKRIYRQNVDLHGRQTTQAVNLDKSTVTINLRINKS